MATVQFKRETDALVQHFARYCGQGIHGGFRLHCQHPGCKEAYDLVPRLPAWSDVTAACGRVVVAYGLRVPNLKRSNNSRGKIGFLLAKRSLQVLRGAMWAEKQKKEPGLATQLYDFINGDLTFANYRLLCEPVADDVINRMLWRSDECPDCRIMPKRNGGKGQTCPKCDQPCCPIHCACSGGRRSRRVRRDPR